jgi:hypothetical protein
MLLASVGMVWLHMGFGISFQGMAYVLVGIVVGILFALLIYFYLNGHQTFNRTLPPRPSVPEEMTNRGRQREALVRENNATQRIERELERLLAQAKSDEHAK